MEVPKDRLATTDSSGDRVYIYPADVKGFFRKYRDWTQAILILVFLLLPWIQIGGEQALLLDIPERRFAIFGLTFWAHDGPLIFFILAILTLGLALITSIWGRVWCGWACPQTVFIDGIFRRIERWIEGNHLARIKLDSEPLSFSKLSKKTLKWLAFFLVSTIISHSFAAYFVGASDLAKMTLHAPSEHWTTFLIVTFINLLVLFDFAWFREQFCIIACPYGRFQSVLMDRNSTAVMYDVGRGEPRKGSELAKSAPQGDCISCTRCVQVCPTGIDIRRGIQLECIACTACIDACDEIMEKVKKPKGLIRYSSISQMEGQKRTFSLRSALYIFLILIASMGLIYSVATRAVLHVALLRAPGAPYRILEEVPNKPIMNQFKAHIQNQLAEPIIVTFELEPAARQAGVKLIQQETIVRLTPGQINTHFLFIEFPQSWMQGSKEKSLDIFINTASARERREEKKVLKILAP